MKKPSGTRVNIMIMGIVVVVLALGLAAIQEKQGTCQERQVPFMYIFIAFLHNV